MGVWQFPADLSIVAWLEHMKYDYEILTDEDPSAGTGGHHVHDPGAGRHAASLGTRRHDLLHDAEHGAVFSASSIAWGSALPCHGFDNSVSRIMKNVVDAFLKPGPLPGGKFDVK